jgi:hypothetical protein
MAGMPILRTRPWQPVIVWLSQFAAPGYYEQPGGYRLVPGEHSYVVVGYDAGGMRQRSSTAGSNSSSRSLVGNCMITWLCLSARLAPLTDF